jgi:hypothetical protein
VDPWPHDFEALAVSAYCQFPFLGRKRSLYLYIVAIMNLVYS